MHSCVRLPPKPAWYELGVKDEGRILTVSVAPTAHDELKRLATNDAPIVGALLELHRFAEFIPPGESSWGFGEVLHVCESERDDWQSWTITIPQVTPRLADGKRDGLREIDWNTPFAISSTLHVLFTLMFILDDECKGDCIEHQLVEYDVNPGRGMGQSGMAAGLSPMVVAWVVEQVENQSHPVIDVNMRNAHMRLFALDALDRYDAYYIGSEFYEPHRIHLKCANNATGLDPDSHQLTGDDRGYELVPHNVDTPMEQLVLLTGVATLEQLVRQSLKNT